MTRPKGVVPICKATGCNNPKRKTKGAMYCSDDCRDAERIAREKEREHQCEADNCENITSRPQFCSTWCRNRSIARDRTPAIRQPKPKAPPPQREKKSFSSVSAEPPPVAEGVKRFVTEGFILDYNQEGKLIAKYRNPHAFRREYYTTAYEYDEEYEVA